MKVEINECHYLQSLKFFFTYNLLLLQSLLSTFLPLVYIDSPFNTEPRHGPSYKPREAK